ncbi:MAG TPA: SRPBCC family protein [Kofleriaceae bacterium]|nr:SRPBCC family protein [Kofleriaceae bacterium]
MSAPRRAASNWPDEMVAARVRAAVARAASHPHAIDVSVDHGAVTLSGSVFQDELIAVMRRVGRVAGVRAIDNQLDGRADKDSDPRLAGPVHGEGAPLERDVWPRSWRFTAAAAGTAVGACGLSLLGHREVRSGLVLSAAGAALIARAATNRPIAHLLGFDGRRAVDLRGTVLIRAPISEVFRFWAQVENFPLFMEHVLEVSISSQDGRRSHWQVRGPAGVSLRWDAEVTRLVPDEMFAWKTLPGSQVEHAGAVHFESMGDDATLLQVRMVYVPPAGALGQLVAAVLGGDPEKRIEEDLARLKSLLEDLHTLAPAGSEPGNGVEPRA